MNGILGRILGAAFAADPRVVPLAHRATVQALMRCRTGELGTTLHTCSECRDLQVIPRGCGNRHCPQCQGRLARAWFARQQADLLETPYFHVVCTLPHVLLPLCALAPRPLYALLFEATAQMLLRLGRERLGGQIGLTLILHTWGQRMTLHPHLHCIVTGGALSEGGQWRRVKSRQYLFPVAVMGALFRGLFLAGLTRLRTQAQVPTPPDGWPKLWKQLGETKRWVVYCRPPFAGPSSVLAYLSNYTHRVAISERRIERFDQQRQTVTFRYRDYADGGTKKSQTLPTTAFARRFCQHLLPRSFTKIRHYGLLANHLRSQRVPLAWSAIAASRSSRQPRKPAHEPPAFPLCAKCGSEDVRCIGLLRSDGRIVVFRHVERSLPPRVPP